MRFDIFAPKVPPVIGVDISDSSVKMVELSMDKNGLCLEHFAIEALPDNVIVDGAVADIDALVASITACYKKLGSRIKGVAASLPSSMVVMKTLKMSPGMSEREIEEQVSSEMSSHISFDIDEASLDFQVVPHQPVDEESTDVSIIASAALRVRVEERAAAFETAGLKAVVIDSDLLALIDVAEQFMNRVGMPQKDLNILIVDLGAHVTHFNFLRNGEVVYSREHAFGGHQLTQEIEGKFTVSQEDAKKIRTGLKPASDDEDLAQMRKDFSASAAQEIKRAVQLFTTSTNFTSVDGILLCGGGVAVPGIEEVVGQEIEIPTRRLKPFEGMSLGNGLDVEWLRQECVSLVVAAGLAMRRFDK